MLTSLKSHLWHVKVYFTDHKGEGAMEFNVEVLQIQKILFSPFRKCHGLLDFELPLARCQPLKIQVIFLLIQQFFLIFLPSKLHEQ